MQLGGWFICLVGAFLLHPGVGFIFLGLAVVLFADWLDKEKS